MLYEAVKAPDARRELRLLDIRFDVMSDTGLQKIFSILSTCFKEKKVSNITAAMTLYEGLRRSPDEGVKAFVARFRDAERVMSESGMTPYSDEARGNKFLISAKLLPSDVRNVLMLVIHMRRTGFAI